MRQASLLQPGMGLPERQSTPQSRSPGSSTPREKPKTRVRLAEAPPGWTFEQRENPGGSRYKIWHGPGGDKARTLREAWLLHGQPPPPKEDREPAAEKEAEDRCGECAGCLRTAGKLPRGRGMWLDCRPVTTEGAAFEPKPLRHAMNGAVLRRAEALLVRLDDLRASFGDELGVMLGEEEQEEEAEEGAEEGAEGQARDDA